MPKKSAKKKTAKKASAKKSPPPAKKTAAKAAKKKMPPKPEADAPLRKTKVIARVDVGFGNNLHIRGEGGGLDWEQGILMENVSPYEWQFETTQAKRPLTFKFLINDAIWAEGDNQKVTPGGTSITSPVFSW